VSHYRFGNYPRGPYAPPILRAAALCLLIVTPAWAMDAKAPPPQTTAELQSRIEAILKRTHTPGAGVAIVGRDGPEWVAGIGLADVASNTRATPSTLFRIGSVSKGFVSLSILKLHAGGKAEPAGHAAVAGAGPGIHETRGRRPILCAS
jgi:CubicO group peptidase (beta-lactamase class C family)